MILLARYRFVYFRASDRRKALATLVIRPRLCFIPSAETSFVSRFLRACSSSA